MVQNNKAKDSSYYESWLKRFKKTIIAAIILGLILATTLIVFLAFEGKDGLTVKIFQNEAPINMSPAPFPFQEMTIPYLRSRAYKSDLSDLTLVSENENYKSFLTSYDSDGLKINGQLTIPQGNIPQSKFPAIVFVHGYIPPQTYQTLANYSSYVDYLARSGFVVFKIDLRGHGDSEGEPGGSYYSSDYIIDVLNAKAALASSDFVSPGKIGLWGHSMAGNVIFRSLAAEPDIPAVVIWAGAVYTYEDWDKYGIQDGSYQPPPNNTERQRRRKLLFDTYGEFDPNSEFWRQVVATNYLSEIQGAIQLNHSLDDNVVNIGYSRDLDRLLDQTNIVHELKEYSSGGHNISDTSFNDAMQNTVNFFKEHLL